MHWKKMVCSSDSASKSTSDVTACLQPDLTGVVTVITGASRGLGRAFAEALAQAGAYVALVSRSLEPLTAAVRRITAHGGRAIGIAADVANSAEVARMTEIVEQQLGPVDLLINNAGITTPLGAVWEVDPEAWWRCIETNLRGPFLCSRSILPGMINRRRGRIINIASTGGMRVIEGYSAYGTSKAALVRLTETMAAEARPHGVQIFALHPGLVKTAMTEYLAESREGRKWLPWIRTVFAEGRDTSPSQAAAMVLFLASGQADSLAGHFLKVTDDLATLIAQIDREENETGQAQ